MKIRKSGKQIDENVLKKFEIELEKSLPSEYREFLLEHNICSVRPNGFHIKHVSEISQEDEPDDMLGCFLGFDDSELKESTLSWALSVYKDRIPKDYIPINFDYGGNVICIGINGFDRGKIFFWDHEREGELDNMLCIADSFESFINSLSEL